MVSKIFILSCFSQYNSTVTFAFLIFHPLTLNLVRESCVRHISREFSSKIKGENAELQPTDQRDESPNVVPSGTRLQAHRRSTNQNVILKCSAS